MKNYLKFYLTIRKQVVTDKELCGETCDYLQYTVTEIVTCELFQVSLAYKDESRLNRCDKCKKLFE